MVALNATQNEVREKFSINDYEREMWNELQIVLEWFEFVTDELQSNKINISRVLPCYEFIKKKILNKKPNIDDLEYDNWADFPHTKTLRNDLLESLEKRFSELVKGDVYMVFTFLDTTFGVDFFDEDKKMTTQTRVSSLIQQQQTVTNILNYKNSTNDQSNNHLKTGWY